MRENGTFLAIVALAAVAVLGDVPGGGAEAPPGPTPAAVSEKAASGAEICDSEVMLEQIEGLYPRFQRELLIATVPDPVDSQAGWLFDAQLEAIVGAIERKVQQVEGLGGAANSNYTRDRYALPWKCTVRDDGREVRGAKDPRKAPGLVVFRNRTETTLLLLFLIGETPTFGIHEQALWEALDVATKGCGSGAHPVRLMAPTFTGSAMSLRAALERWWDRNEHCPTASFKIISGSASDFRNKGIIEDWVRMPVKVRSPLTVSFQATVVPEEAVLNAVYRHIEARGADLDSEVALLAEAGTSYGKSAFGGAKGPLVLNFPMRMGRLRGAGRTAPPGKGVATSANGGRLFGLELDEIGSPRDLFPTYSPGMHNPSDELVVGHLLSTISREKYRYVGLLATDPRDKLHLATLIRRYCPDVGLFTVQSDLLYTHSDFNRYLEGMIVGSTYPLFNSNQLWSPPWRGVTERLQFPRNMAQGAYNATLALLDRRDLVDYGPPFGSGAGRPGGPAIWLTVVGHEALWPLKAEIGYRRFLGEDNARADERSPYTYPSPLSDTGSERTYRLRAPRHFHIVGWLLLIFLFIHLTVWGRRYAAWRQTGVSPWEWLCLWLPSLLLFALGFLWWWVSPAEPPIDREGSVDLFALRTANLQSGVSVLSPLLLLAGAAYVLGYSQLKRLGLRRERLTEPTLQEPLAERFSSSLDHARARDRGWGELSTLEGAIEDAVNRPPWQSDRLYSAVLFAIVLVSTAFGLSWVIPVIDSKVLHYALILGQGALLLGVLLSFRRFAVLWRELTGLLRHFSMHPMVGAFERLPRRLIGQLRWHPLPVMPRAGPLLGQYFDLLAHHVGVLEAAGGGTPGAVAAADAGLKAAQSTRGRLALAMPAIAEVVRTERWLRPPLTAAPEAADRASAAPRGHQPREVWLDRAEELIAIHVAQYVNYLFLHLWSLLSAATLALLLLLYAASAYPLQPQRLLNAFLFAVALIMVGWTLRVLVQINRNDLLSRIQKTEPNRTTFDRQFASQLLLYGVVPVLSLLAAQFPELSWVFSWVEDVLRLVK
jgi:hypothetical protein